MEKISGVVIAYNEEKLIADCLKSLSSFCDEIILVDSYSTDNTVQIASEYASKIIKRKFDTYVVQKTFATEQAENNWVFSLDADERVSSELADHILELKKKGFNADGYWVNRLSYYINGFFKCSGWYPDCKIRLFKKNCAYWGGTDPHDKVIMNAGCVAKKIELDLIHFTYRNMHHHIDKVNSFSTKAAVQKLNKKPKFVRMHFVLNPCIKFIKSYFIQGGVFYGSRGFINSVIASFYVFIKYAKVWESLNQKEPDHEIWQKKIRK